MPPGRRRHRALLERLPEPGASVDPAELVADRDGERSGRLREVLADARPADRELIVLTAMEGFTVREAALTLGIGESAAKMRLSRLRAKLRTAADDRPLEAATAELGRGGMR